MNSNDHQLLNSLEFVNHYQLRNLLEADRPLTEDSQGVQHLKSLEPINYICLGVLLLILLCLLIILKNHFIKYVGFYIIRRDFERLKAVPTNQPLDNGQNYQNTPITSKRLTFSQKKQIFKENFKRNMTLYHPVFYYFAQKITQTPIVKLPFQIHNGLTIISLLILATFALLVSRINSSICEIQKFMRDKSFQCQNANNQGIQGDGVLQLGLSVLVVLISLSFIIVGTYYISKNYFKFIDQLRLSNLETYGTNQQLTQAKEEADLNNPKNLNNNGLGEQQLTLQNMLGEDSETTRRSLKPTKQDKNSKKNLFQINEDEEEEPFSPSKSNNSEIQVGDSLSHKNVLDENKNLLNNGNSTNFLKLSSSQLDYQINDPPQFSSYNKNNEIEGENMSRESHEKNKKYLKNAYSDANLMKNNGLNQVKNQLRPKSQLKSNRHNNNSQFNKNGTSNYGLSDDTTIIDGGIMNQANTSSKNLNMDQENEDQMDIEKFAKDRRQVMTTQKRCSFDKNTPSQNELSQNSKEESKDEDSSRILMMKNGQRTQCPSRESNLSQSQNTEKNQGIYQILLVIFLLAIISSLILCIGFLSYSFYNMTTHGLVNALSIFGLSVILDIMLLRVIVIAVISVITAHKEIKITITQKFTQAKLIEDDEIGLLEDIYLEYQAPINNFMTSHTQNTSIKFNCKSNIEKDEESSDQQINLNQTPDNNNNPQEPVNNYLTNQRFLKFKSKNNKMSLGEMMLVDSTYFYHQPQLMPLSEIKKQIEIHEQELKDEAKIINRSKQSHKQKIEISDTIQFDAERDLKLRQAHQEKSKAKDTSNYDIEEIQMDSMKKEQQIEYINPCDDPEAQLQDSNYRSSILPQILTSHHQFETPKGLHTKAQFARPILPGINISQQAIAFNEIRESINDRILLRNPSQLNSNSSKKLKAQLGNGSEYQSLQRYLNDDKENQNSINKSLKKRVSIGASGLRQKKYLDEQQLIFSPSQNILNFQQNQDELIRFNPQYTSLNKKNTINGDKNSANQSLRKSLALPEMFSEMSECQLITQLNKSRSKKKRSKKTSTVKKQNEQDKENSQNEESNLKQLISGRKSFNSPSKIKENLEEKLMKLNQMSNQRQSLEIKLMSQPDIQPFRDRQRLNQIDDEIYTEAPTMEVPSPRQHNVRSSVEFDNNLKKSLPQVRDSANSTNLKQFLQPQLMKQKTKEKQKKQEYNRLESNQSESTINLNNMNEMFNVKPIMNSSVEDTIDQKTSQVVSQAKLNNQIKPKIRPKKLVKKKKEQAMQNTFQTEENSKSFISNTLGNLMKDTEEQIEISEINRDTHNNSKFDDTYRSKMFEDSDQSTFRMINFTGAAGLGSRQRSKRQISSQNDYITSQTSQNNMTDNSSQAPIDFYSNVSQPLNFKEEEKKVKEYKAGQDQKKSKKPSVAEIILEENIATVNSSPEKNPKIAIFNIQQSASSSKINTFRQDDVSDVVEDQNIGEFNLVDQIDELNVEILEKQINEGQEQQSECDFNPKESNLAHYMNKKSAIQILRKPLQSKADTNDMESTQREKFNSAFDSANVNQNLRYQEEQRRKREDLEILQLRIEEQRRKLKNFLKLARQLKSTKDEKKIKEFLKYFKTEQKPLPYKKINELKSLEIMSSPYNQSLIDMIKDEYDKFSKVDKKSQNENKHEQPKNKQSKSQIRNMAKQNDLISKLGGIYGQSIGNSQFASNQRDQSQKGRADSITSDFKVKEKLAPSRSKLLISSRQKFSRDSSNSAVEQSMRFKKRGKRNQVQLLDSNTNTNPTFSGADDSQVVTLKNQLKVENFGQTTSEEEDNINKVKLVQTKNKIEIRDSDEFNNLESFLQQ
ncbi:UNKNOWN [Stylonychia lemnae]|uniref:Transmembrane protein n=1 Tax=Stylonychia lemnae TaxID=5949 RepID=A0A077ZRP3_STYLE|nr:UNKNOWN [Stylonychia lemnae]|eukprot:CDW71171.1 UNKNOWN [Stylonychia lemnae]